MRGRIAGILAALLLVVACDDGGESGTVADQSVIDGSLIEDAAPKDASPPDAEPPPADAAPVDARLPDASPPDAAPPDAAPPACTADSCPAGEVCGPDGACLPRCVAGGCPGGHCGPDGLCADGACAEDVSCAAGAWCTPGGACADGCRLDPDDCGAGRRCEAARRTCVECLADDACGDGADGDCDGQVDEGCDCVVDAPCDTGLAGPCGAGRVTCDGGRACVPARVGAEACNGADDDCDGRADEDFPTLGEACRVGVGVCGREGALACGPDGAVACDAVADAPGSEACNGLDDDCDGAADENWADLGEACVVGGGACAREGVRVCRDGAETRCDAVAGQPAAEQCNGVDDDCDGRTDEALAGGPLSRSCYEGPDGTEGVGFCRGGRATCVDGAYAACEGQVLPAPEVCNGEDDDCDGRVDRTPANERLTQACYGGPPGTAGQGPCIAGVAECRFGQFEACVGEVLPAEEICDSADNDCDGEIDDVAGGCACQPGEARDCYPGPAGTAGQGICRAGRQTCLPDGSGFTACDGAVLPRAEACNGVDDDCDGQIDDAIAGVGQPCADGVGACLARGVTTCDGAAIRCDAVAGPPAAERCDALDNDCDGRTDEAFALGQACDVGVGACQAQGETVCGPDGAAACSAQPGAPGAEVCNGGDDDCDGTTDEGLADLGDCATGQPGVCGAGQRSCAAGAEICTARVAPGAELCDGLDNDCDGPVDESLGQVPCGVGACARAIPACAGGAPSVCDPRAGAVDEVCNGLDDDCDGQTDEGLGLGQACGAGQGACAAQGRIICNAAGEPVCDAVAGQPAAERCNGADDDCDGRTDEQAQGVGEACSAGLGACLTNGARQCVGGQLACDAVAGPPAAEACDAVDNDCDGRADEGFGLGQACMAGVGACAAAGQIACDPNGLAACNAVVGQPAAELCNGADDDCDGRADEQAQGAGVACSAGVGACLRPGTRQCVGGQLACDAVAAQPGAERCDAVDNDCDGRTDEQPVDAGGGCREGNGGCAVDGRVICVAGALDCDAVPRPPAAEICDNQDQDCDGRSDEGQPDCDGNGLWDACDLQFGRQRDCDANGVPDACDIQGGAPDCDGDGILDACNDACAVDVTPPVVNLFVQGNPINRGSVIQIVVQAQDDVGVTGCQLFVGAQEIPLDAFCQAFVGFPNAGYFDVIGVARDAAGNEGRQTVRMRVLDPNDVAFPDLAIHAPPNGSTIRQPTDVVASVQDANLVEWVLSYGPQANPAANVIARGGQNVANQPIGVLDPSVIPVGQWALRLFAEDINGRSRTLVGSFTIAACVPAAEVCDGRDNDCDQRVDEQPVDAGGPCTQGEGVCERAGTVQCAGGATLCDAVPGQPAGAEACNRLDDDCDGRVDESAACPDVQPPEIQIAVVPAVADPGTPVRVTVTATDDRGVTALTATLDGAPLALDANGVAVFNAPAQPGVHVIAATARDAAGNQTVEQAELRVNAPGDVDPPVVAFTAPADAAELRGPTPVRGTVSDVALVRWTLAFAALDGGAELQDFATGNQNALDAFLADLPVERMMPGYNRLRLTAEDAGGRVVFTERIVQVAAAPRPGQIRFCVNDMRVDVAGLPITIDRCYDSRDKGRRGFGFGWTLDISSGYVMQNRPVAQGWQHEQRCERQVLGQCIQFGCSAPETLRHMTVSFTGGDRFFRFRPEITNTSLLDGVCLGSVRWVADARTPAGWTLRTLDNTEIWLFPGESELLDQFDFTPFDPRRFELRGPNGERVVFTQGRGVDLYDNGAGVQVEFNAGGIVHSAGPSLDFERDANGSITRITDPEGAAYTYAYDGRGDLVAVTDRVGATWRYQYDAQHNMTAIIRPDGTPMQATYDDEGRLTGFGLEGARADVVYDPDNQEVRVTDRNGDERVLVYDALGNVVSETDAEGNTVLREVDENGRVTRLETPEGRVTSYAFEGTNKLPTRITSPLGHVHENTFDAEGRLRNVLLPDGRSAQLDYPAGAGTATLTVDGRVVTEIVDNAQGNTEIQRMAGGEEIRFAYDAQGRKSQVTYPDGTLERFTYDGNGRVLTQLDRAGGTTRLVYDAEGRVLSRTDACGGETRYTYDALGRQTRIVDALGRATEVEYDIAGNRSRLVQPDGAEFAWSYDAENRPLEDRLPGGLSLSRTYDSQGRTLTETDSAGGVTRYTYDGDGLHVGTALPNGLVQRMERDGEGRIISDTLPAPMAMTRDSNGYVTSMTDALGHTTRYEHTLEGMVTRELYPDGTERRFEVDADMRLTAGVDEAGGRTVFDRTYDGRVIATTLPDGLRWAFDYLGTGELTSVTDPDGRETRMSFDPCRRMTSLEHPDGATVGYAYDAVGNITRIDHPDGTFVERSYDAADRMIREARSDGTESRMTWTGFGRPATFTDERGVTGFTYDAGGRLTEMNQPDGARLRFGYDTAGRRVFAEARTPAGDVWRLDYLYDPVFGALSAIVQGGQAVVTYGRDDAGQLTSIEYANGIRQLYMRDARGRVTQLTTRDAGGAIVADRRLTRDARGLITREIDEQGVERRYTYDANERMTREERLEAGATVLDRRYAYDSRGNLASVTEAGAEDVHRLDDRSRLLEAGGRTFDYNDRGELVRITEGGQAIDLTFDLEGRLREVDGPDGTRRYRYDHLGNRVSDEVDGAVVGHLVAPRDAGPDATFRLPWTLVDYDADGRLIRGYVAGPILHGVSEAGSTRFALSDPRGSVTGWADAQGAVNGRVDYDAWGQIIEGDLGPEERGFLGMPTDPTTGLVHLRARSYDPRAGRFISPDPVFGSPLDPRTFAPYTYALNAPATYIDPTGEFVSLPSVMTAITVMSTLYSIGSIAWRLWHGEKVAWWEFVVAALSCVVPVMQGAKLAYIFFSRGALMRESGRYVWFHYTTAKTGEAILSSSKLIPGAAAGGKVWVTDIPPALMFNKWVGWYYQLTIGAWGGKLINFGKGAQATTQLEVAVEFTTAIGRFRSAKMLNQFMAIGEEILTDAKSIILH